MSNNPTLSKAPSGLVPTEAAARQLGISEYTIRKLARERKLPCYRPFGKRGRISFDPNELEEFVRSSRVGPTADATVAAPNQS